MSLNGERKNEILEEDASENDTSSELLKTKKNSETKSQKSSEPELKKSSDPETGSIESTRSLSQRFVTWTLNDLFDFNPGYLKSLRGILNLVQIIFNMFVVALVGSACRSTDPSYAGFYCRTPDTFTFVIACSAFIQSVVFFACCLLSKKAERRIHVTSYEVVYYVTYALFFLIAGMAITTSSLHIPYGNYQINMGAGVFCFCATVAYSCSAIWFLMYHKMYAQKIDDECLRCQASNNT